MRYEEVETEDADVLVVAYGSVSRCAREAVRMARANGLKAGLLRPITAAFALYRCRSATGASTLCPVSTRLKKI